jgi:PAS domain S-box-containing protein
MKFRTKLFLIVSIVSILPFSLLFYFSYQYSSNAAILNSEQNLSQISKLKLMDFERWLVQNQNNIENLAQRPLLRDFTQILITAPDDPDGVQVHSNLLKDHLLPNLNVQGGFEDFSILRASDGYALVSTNDSIKNTYRANNVYFTQGLKRTYVDQVRYELSNKIIVMHISTPIRNDHGVVIGVLAGHLDLREMSLIMSSGQDLSQTENTYLINKSNFFVTDSRFSPGSMLTRTAYSQGISNCLNGASGFEMYSNYRDVQVLSYYQWLPDLNICMLTEIDQSEAFQPIENMLYFYLIFGAVSILGLFAISAVLSKNLTNPITALEKGAQAIGSGDLDFRLKDISKDEIGVVSDSFNQMANSLQKSREQITQTRDLLVTLQQAAQTIQNLNTHAQVFKAASAEIARLGFDTSIFILDESRKKLAVEYLSFGSKTIQLLEKLIGISWKNYSIPIKRGSLFQQVINTGEPLFVDDFKKITEEALPKKAAKFVGRIIEHLGIHQGIVCRLRSADITFGVLAVSGKYLIDADMAAISTFANQMANALRHIDLVEEIIHAAAELENRVRERTIAIEESQLASLNMMEDLQEENTARQIAQKNLLQEKEKAQLYLDIAGTMFVALDTSGKITLINRRGCQVLGYQEQELIGKNWFETCLPEDTVEEVKQVFQQLMAGDVKPVEYYENPARTKAGELRTIAWHNSILRHGKSVIGLLSSGEDVTESKIAQQEIKDSRDKYQSLFSSMLNGFALHEIVCDADGIPVDYRFLEVNNTFEEMTELKSQDIIGRTVLEVLPKTEPIWIEKYGRVALTGEPIMFEQYSSQVGKHFLVNAYSPKSGQFATTFSDVTERVTAENRIQSLLEISSRVTQQPYDQKPLQTALDEIIKNISKADSASIWLFNPEKDIFEVEAWVGFPDELMHGLTVQKDHGLIALAYKNKTGLIENNIPSNKDSILHLKTHFPAIQSVICAPLVTQNKSIGAISVDNNRKEDAFTPADLSMLESIALQLSGVIENTRLFEQIQHSREELRLLSKRLVDVQEEERKLVAMDLHDYFGQVLTSLKLSMRPESFIKKNISQQRELIHGANLLIDEIMDSAEDLSLRLRPTIIDDLGIAPAFEWHVKRYKKQTDLNITLEIGLEHGKRYPPEIEITLYRIMEEGLTNAARYAKSDQININVWEQDEHIHLIVQDDGVGFDMNDIENEPGQHTGIMGIKERIRLLSGSIDIFSKSGQGTTITVSLPILGSDKKPKEKFS